MIKKNDFIEIEYTGRLKEEGAVFDTTDEKTAKESHLYREDMEYGPITVCIGEKHVLKGIEDFIIGKDVGSYTIDIKPEDAFGKKNAKLIQMIPSRKFTEHGIKPVPGLSVNVDGMIGLVKSASGGRILVDFNHPLAGKELVYDIKVRKIVTGKEEQIRSLLSLILSLKKEDSEIELKDKEAKVKIKKKFPDEVLKKVGEKIKELAQLSKIELTAE
ncbi:peptidylprolyl isomerase [Candidatus Woesearchaeota archaeon]|nr:peptidylprolyl isomerase [Candidatus Woesearchaeota archaeon]